MPTPNLIAAAASTRSEAEARADRKLHLRLAYRVGQIWSSRDSGGVDRWTIVAISQHPLTPVIAQNANGSVREFDLNGYFGGSEDGEEYPQDLVTLVRDVAP